MTRALAISKKQAQTLFKAAEAERGIVEIKVGQTVIRLIPACHAQPERPIDEDRDPESFETLAEYLAWRDRSAGGD